MAPTDNIYRKMVEIIVKPMDIVDDEEEEEGNLEDVNESIEYESVIEETPTSSITVSDIEMDKSRVRRRLFESDSEED